MFFVHAVVVSALALKIFVIVLTHFSFESHNSSKQVLRVCVCVYVYVITLLQYPGYYKVRSPFSSVMQGGAGNIPQIISSLLTK